MKVTPKAQELLNQAFAVQSSLCGYPMIVPYNKAKCRYNQHKEPNIIFSQSGSVYFNCGICGQDLVPTGFKTAKKK